MNTETDRILLEGLQRLHARVTGGTYCDWFDTDEGLCTNISQFVDQKKFDNEKKFDICRRLHSTLHEWPDKSHENGYPVGGYDQFMEEQRANRLWSNPWRIRLLEWLIDYFAQETQA